MHYRNGREAKNGDKVIQLDFSGNITALGVLHSATPGNDYCNGVVLETVITGHDESETIIPHSRPCPLCGKVEEPDQLHALYRCSGAMSQLAEALG